MGKRLTSDHPGLKRIKQLFEDHMKDQEKEVAATNHRYDPSLNTTTYEPGKLQVIGDLVSEAR